MQCIKARYDMCKKEKEKKMIHTYLIIKENKKILNRIRTGQQTVIFHKDIPLSLSNIKGKQLECTLPIYLYSLSKENEGKIIGKIETDRIYAPMYQKEKKCLKKSIKERNELIRTIYEDYCKGKNIICDMNKIWNNENGFQTHLIEIGYDNIRTGLPIAFNYAIHIKSYQEIEKAIPITVFVKSDGTPINGPIKDISFVHSNDEETIHMMSKTEEGKGI